MKKSLRFKIIERDNFTCQYCGKTPPEAILHVDHIYPKSKGGTDDEINLITSCSDCNLGKKAKVIKNPKTKKEIKQQLQSAKEKEELLEEYHKYKSKLKARETRDLQKINKHWKELWGGNYELGFRGKVSIKRFLKFTDRNDIIDSMDIAYMRIDDDAYQCFRYFCGVVNSKKKKREQELEILKNC